MLQNMVASAGPRFSRFNSANFPAGIQAVQQIRFVRIERRDIRSFGRHTEKEQQEDNHGLFTLEQWMSIDFRPAGYRAAVL
jgi:hypothetical protein